MGRVADWVQAELSAKETADETSLEERRVTCRIDGGKFFMLHKVSDLLGMSKTACAEKLLEEAIQEAWKTLDMGEPNLGEMMSFYNGSTGMPSEEEQIIEMLKHNLEEAKKGKIKSAVFISMDGAGQGGLWARVKTPEDGAAVETHLEALKQDLKR